MLIEIHPVLVHGQDVFPESAGPDHLAAVLAGLEPVQVGAVAGLIKKELKKMDLAKIS